MTTDAKTTKPRRAMDDLVAMDIGGLVWDRDGLEDSLQKVYVQACKKTTDAIAWYQHARKKRRLAAQLLRFLAAALVVGGTLVPVVAPMWSKVPSELGYVLIVASGACLLVNRAMGLSSGWIRYIRTSFLLEKALESFQLDWAQTLTGMGGHPGSPKEVEALQSMLKDFVAKVNRLLIQEIQAWAEQFNKDLALLEGASQKTDAGSNTSGTAGANP